MLKNVNIIIFILNFFVKNHIAKIPNVIFIAPITTKFPIKKFLIINVNINIKAVILIKELME
ncbi:hypothetical protein B0537_02470 [Desulforamulus ferrireducens]|uniref:Uncharacterized protein n=1 Tax=Desulforamulus ferrireducens TaxID=1833852 RepID=A0A1S6ITF4_9FIRM|nr:hypothetical protein B0537_02470 [Desulforamulus ferrireducens]